MELQVHSIETKTIKLLMEVTKSVINTVYTEEGTSTLNDITRICLGSTDKEIERHLSKLGFPHAGLLANILHNSTYFAEESRFYIVDTKRGFNLLRKGQVIASFIRSPNKYEICTTKIRTRWIKCQKREIEPLFIPLEFS